MVIVLPVKVARHLCFKNSKNLQLLDVQACNSANRAAFQNPTKNVNVLIYYDTFRSVHTYVQTAASNFY